MAVIYTHLDLDVDAAASIWLWRRLYKEQTWEVRLKPATWTGSDLQQEDVAIELEAAGNGLRARRNPDGSVSSCFRVIMTDCVPPNYDHEDIERLERMVGPIADLMDVQRRDGNLSRLGFPPRYGIYGLSGTFLALKRTTEDEKELLGDFSRILDGFMHLAELSTEVSQIADEVEFVGREVAVIMDQDNPGLHRAIFRRGAKFIVFKDGKNLGILREARERRHLGNLLQERIKESGWFFHPRGHLAARGTRRAPARSDSQYQPAEIAKMLKEALESHGDYQAF